MRISIIHCFAFVLAATLFSCSDESPFLTETEARKGIKELNNARDPFHAVTHIAAIINNDVYYFARLDSVPKRLTFTPTVNKTDIKLSADKTQIAYLNNIGTPVVISAVDGSVIATLTAFSYVRQIDWAKDRKSLYFLSEQKIYTYGAPLTVSQPQTTYPWDEVSSFSMNAKGDQGYFIKYYGDFQYTLKYVSSSKSLDKSLKTFDQNSYNFIDFYDNNGNFMLGSRDASKAFSRIVCVEDYNFYTAYYWDYEAMTSPEFSSDHEILLYGTMNNQVYQIKAVYLGTEAYEGHGLYDVLTKTITEYTSKSPIYLDWSH
jgi:hypothetical protein